MRRAPYRTSDLTALLDALEQDLLDVPAAELHDAQRETGRAWETSCQEIRSMLNEVIAATEDDVAAATPIRAHPKLNAQTTGCKALDRLQYLVGMDSIIFGWPLRARKDLTESARVGKTSLILVLCCSGRSVDC